MEKLESYWQPAERPSDARDSEIIPVSPVDKTNVETIRDFSARSTKFTSNFIDVPSPFPSTTGETTEAVSPASLDRVSLDMHSGALLSSAAQSLVLGEKLFANKILSTADIRSVLKTAATSAGEQAQATGKTGPGPENAPDSIVRIQTGRGVDGLGLVMNADSIATDLGTIANLPELRVLTADGKSYPTRIHDVDHANDLAILKIEGRSSLRGLETPPLVQSILQRETPEFTGQYRYTGAEWTRHNPLSAGAISVSAGMGVESLLRMPTLVERIDIYRMEVKPLGYRMTQKLNIGLGLYGLASLNSDARALYNSTNDRDSLKYAVASLGDTGMVSGALIRHAAMDGGMAVKFRTGKVGVALLAAGVAVKLASDLIPNRLVRTDYTNGDLQPASSKKR